MKIFAFIFAVLLTINGFSQSMYASLGEGSSQNRIKIYLKPDQTQAKCVFSTLQFNIALPATISPIPTVSIVSSVFPGVVWKVDSGYIEGGYINFNIYTGNVGYALPITANVEFVAMEVTFENGPAGLHSNAAHLVTLPDGGKMGNSLALYYCTGSMSSDGSNLYYARDANVIISNAFSYRGMNNHQGSAIGTTPSFARFAPSIALGEHLR